MTAGPAAGAMAGAGNREPTVRVGSRFYRAHGLGNDYLVFEAVEREEVAWMPTAASVRKVCDRHTGLGADGIVVLVDRTPGEEPFPLRMFNPDGSEFERSGNGLRVLASHLAREKLVTAAPFRVRSGGAEIEMTVHEASSGGEYDVSVDMGRVRIGLDAVDGDPDHLDREGRAVHPSRGPVPFVPVSVGNPHAVVFPDDSSDELLVDLGPFLSGHPAFRAGTNVQLVEVVGPDRIRIRIWERGVGRTFASGTSSCASVVAAAASGRIERGRVIVEMDGGALQVSITPQMEATLRGPVMEVAEGRLTGGFVEALGG